MSNFQGSDGSELEIAGQLERAIEQRWQEMSAHLYTSPHRAVADITRDGEEILSAAGLEGVPPFPGCLKVGGGNGSSNLDLRLYSCTALTKEHGGQALVIELEVNLTRANGDHELPLDTMLASCPKLRVVTPRNAN